MNVSIFGDSTLGVARSWLDGLSRRSQAIGDNIANVDTPGYRAKQVSFETELRRAMGGGPARLATTDARHILSARTAGSQLSVQEIQSLTSRRRDGNDVDVEAQMVSLAETQMRYQAAASAISTRIATLNQVIRG